MNVADYGFEIYEYGTNYLDFKSNTTCTNCKLKHREIVHSSVEHHICEKEIRCPSCSSSLLYMYGNLTFTTSETIYHVGKDGNLTQNEEL